MGKGQFLDQTSYLGNIRLALLGCVLVIFGWYLDEIGHWLWHQFGEELVVQPGKMRRDVIAFIVMGCIAIVSAAVNLIRVFLLHRKSMT